MSIQFTCSECGEPYELPDEARGRKAKCACGAMLVVPTESDTRPPQSVAPAAARPPDPPAAAPTPAVPEDPRGVTPPALPRGFVKPEAAPTEPGDGPPGARPTRRGSQRDAAAIARFAKVLEWLGYLFVVSYAVGALFGVVAAGLAIANNQVVASLPFLGGVVASLVGAWVSWLAFPAAAALLRTFVAIEENTRRE